MIEDRHELRLQYIWLIAFKAGLEKAMPGTRHLDTLLRPPHVYGINLVEEYATCLVPIKDM